MSKPTLNRALRRSALTVALGFTLASGAVFAQSAVGSIFGHGEAGTTVTIENTGTGQTRDVTVSSDGQFSFRQLPTGSYRVVSGTQTRDVQVVVGTGTSVDLTAPSSAGGDATTLDRIEVVGTGINPIDVSSAESTTVFSQAQIQALPVARDISAVALLAPGTVQGDTGIGAGNLASFGGSSVAENGYYINGFDVTNIRNFISYANLPFDAIGATQIKTGGYGAEFGRSLGGVLNLVTKRGTNEWKGGASVYWTPASLRESGRDVRSRDQGDIDEGRFLSVYRSRNTTDDLSVNAYVSGPIVKDRLFIFALAEGQNYKNNRYSEDTSSKTSDSDPTGMVKLDWNITDNHLLEFTGIRNKEVSDYTLFRSPAEYSTERPEVIDSYSFENGGDVFIAKYTGYLTDNFTLSLQAGRLENVDNYRTSAPAGADCPAAYDSRSGGLDYIGCWNEAAFTVTDRAFGPDTDEREAYRIDAEWQLGDHLLRFGYDDEKFTSGHAGATYSGGIYYRYFPDNVVRVREYQTTSASYEVRNKAAYIEDNWQITDNFLATVGLRSESFNNKNGDGISFVEANNLLAPRLGFSWDVNGDSSFKLYGTAGRYYIPVASNTNIRASGGEVLTTTFYDYTGIDPVTGAPITLGAILDGPNVNGSLTSPDPRTLASTDLDPMYQDEYILGGQWALANNWVFGVKGVFRDVKNGMDDYCSHQPFVDFAQDNGYENFDPGSMAGCFIINPGRDVTLALDLENDGNFVNTTVPNSYLGLPEYQRKYRAIEFNLERPKTDGLYLQGSYTYAKSTGNIEGYVNSSLEQDDAGLTQDFDHKIFEDGAYGNLPNDRRHTLKLFGSYDLSDEWAVSTNVLVTSGRPVNCLGYIPLDADLGIDEGGLDPYGPSSFYCSPREGERVLGQRGDQGRTPWQSRLDLGVSYMPTWANDQLELKVDIFNVLNQDAVTEYNETSEISRTPTPGAEDDPTLPPYTYDFDPNFLNDQNYQTPRYFRISARYTW